VETTQLAPQLAAVNVAANYALCFLGILLGRLVVRWSV
jgi:fluoride ion exporter CrcB/FEX